MTHYDERNIERMAGHEDRTMGTSLFLHAILSHSWDTQDLTVMFVIHIPFGICMMGVSCSLFTQISLS
jgi:hypothetical protein